MRTRRAVTGTLVGVRLQAAQIRAIDAWAAMQKPPVTRPEAIRCMVDAMLNIVPKDPGERLQRSDKHAAKANELAAHAIDRLADPAAPAEEQANRKQRLLKGPEEFRGLRVDPAKRK